MENLNEINEIIKKQELEILEKANIISETKKSLDIAILDKCISLENEYAITKDKSLSNQEKRVNKAMLEPAINKLAGDIKKLEYELDILKIEKRFNERKIKINSLNYS